MTVRTGGAAPRLPEHALASRMDLYRIPSPAVPVRGEDAMSFVLLGKQPNGRCYLVSDRLFDSRAEALDELARLTGEPTFSGWDDEIVVLDDASGAPVLLVRPAEPRGFSEAAEGEPAEERAVLAEESAAVPREAEELVTETIVVETPVPETGPEARDADADRARTELKEALARSAAQLEAEGVVPPASVEPAGEQDRALTAPAAWPWDVESAPAADGAGAAGELAESASVAASAPEAQAPVAGPSAAPEEDVVQEPRPEDGGLSAAPPVRDPLEEPGYDDEPLIRVSVGPDILEAALGAAGLAASLEGQTEAGEASDFVDLSAMPVDSAESGPAPAPTTDALTSAPAADDAGAPSPSSSLETMTCDDCVYVETCPNSGQRTPASCGSFQWK